MTIDKIRTSDGAEHAINYEALENLPVIYCKALLLFNSDLGPNESHELDLSSYLPNDDYAYRVWLKCYSTATDTIGSFMAPYLVSSMESDFIYAAGAESSGASNTGGKGIGTALVDILVGSDRKLKLSTGTSSLFKGSAVITAVRYQKVNAVKVED